MTFSDSGGRQIPDAGGGFRRLPLAFDGLARGQVKADRSWTDWNGAFKGLSYIRMIPVWVSVTVTSTLTFWPSLALRPY